jgi:diadenosine tetraphosphate (Ap4A) HIT family hydrolase
MNSTLTKFGHPNTTIKSYSHWSVLLRPQQVTLGSLVLANHSDAQALSALQTEAMTELSDIIKDIESVLTRCFKYDKINYLMLMMIDPHVHFHIIPRYECTRKFGSIIADDLDWPGPPNLGQKIDITDQDLIQLKQYLKEQWNDS